MTQGESEYTLGEPVSAVGHMLRSGKQCHISEGGRKHGHLNASGGRIGRRKFARWLSLYGDPSSVYRNFYRLG